MQVSKQGKAQVVHGCPCFRPLRREFTDDKQRTICVNDENVREMKLSAFPSWKHEMLEKNENRERFRAVDHKLCYATVYLDYSRGCVYCVSQGWPLRIHERDVAPKKVRDTAAAMLGNMTRIWVEPGPPPDLALIRRRIQDAEEYKPEWKYYRLMQYLPKLLGLDGIGLIDMPPNVVFEKIREGGSKSALRRTIIENWKKQVERGGTTIGFEVEKMKEHSSFVRSIDRILELRQREMERVVIYTNLSVVGAGINKADLRPLWVTAYGFQILRALNLGTSCPLHEFSRVHRALDKAGFEIETIEADVPIDDPWEIDDVPINISHGLATYVWRNAEYTRLQES